MSERVSHLIQPDTYVVHEDETESASVKVATAVIAPSETSDDGRENECNQKNKLEVPTVLELDDRVLCQVADIGNTWLATWLEHHPADMRPEKAVVGSIGVEISVGITVVSAVSTGPPFNRALNGASASNCQEIFQRLRCVVSAVCPETMVPCRNSQSVGGKISFRTPMPPAHTTHPVTKYQNTENKAVSQRSLVVKMP